MTLTIELPWPDRRLSPNARVSWQAKLEPKKTAREAGYFAARAAPLDMTQVQLSGDLFLKYIFHPPDRRKRDADNLIKSMKNALDGVCDALRIDDSQFVEGGWAWGDVDRDGGHVVMEISVHDTR